MKPAIVLLSGGIDSATALAIAKAEGFSSYALSIDYGQRHKRELEAAKKIARGAQVANHLILRIELDKIGGSALTEKTGTIPKGRSDLETLTTIPVTYVPARNAIFLSIALAWAEVIGCEVIYIGANAIDYSGYPDCRPEFLESFERMAALATKAGVENNRTIQIRAPLLYLTKGQIIQRGVALGVDYGLTWSCYDPHSPTSGSNNLPCGLCDSCLFRQKGFLEAGITDPLTGL